MIYSTGIDVVDCARIQRVYDRFGRRFLDRLFTPDETKHLMRKKAGMIASISGKFAAKEAVMKALGAFFDSGVAMRDIEILSHSSGMPYVRLADRLSGAFAGKKILISISHEKRYAVASAIITDEI